MTTSDSDLDKGTEGTNPKGSDNQGDKPGSETATITKEQLDALMGRFDQLEKRIQSDKDRAVKGVNQKIDKLTSEVKPLLERASQLFAEGKSVDQVVSQFEAEQDEAELRDTVRLIGSALKEGKLPAALAGREEQKGVSAVEVLERFKLDPADPRVAAFANQSFPSEEAAEVAAAKLLARLVSAPGPTDASVPASVGRPAPSKTDLEKLQSEYDEGKKNLRGDALIRFKMEMRRKGLPVN